VDHPKDTTSHTPRHGELTHISLCAGYGGIDLGLSRALGNVRTIAFSEIEAFATANLVAKMEQGWLDSAPVWTDLKTFPWEQFRGSVDILSGGFPCQPFSAAGRRAGDDDPRHLWPHIVRGIRELGHPPVVFFENVEGILSSKLSGDHWSDPAGTPVLLHVLRELERLGYQATAGVFSAREVGAPHQRKRVFILGTNLNTGGREFVSNRLQLENPNSTRNPEVSILRPEQAIRCRGEGVSRLFIRSSSSSNLAPRGAEQCGRGGSKQKRTQVQDPESSTADNVADTYHPRHDHTAYPAPRGAEQYWWEPPRVVGDTDHERLQGRGVDEGNAPLHQQTREGGAETRALASTSAPSRALSRQTEPSLGGDAHGSAYWVDNAEQYVTCDNRTDELRLLGNGVVPDTAERAFSVLWSRVAHTSSVSTR
jgi:DNA-cytosine methyltransferase